MVHILLFYQATGMFHSVINDTNGNRFLSNQAFNQNINLIKISSSIICTNYYVVKICNFLIISIHLNILNYFCQ